jgi:hypothetical protein
MASRTNETNICPFNDILDLLDQGASLFRAKKYMKARSAFTQALAINKAMLVSEIRGDFDYFQGCNLERPHGGISSSSFPTPSSRCSGQEFLNYAVTRSTNVGALNNAEINDDDFCTWQVDQHTSAYPFLLVVQSCSELFELFQHIPSRDTQLTFSFIIVFNMAVSQHLYSLDQIKEGCSFSTRRALLNKAFLLYKHSEALLHQLQLYEGSSCIVFLSLVIFNNEAQVLLTMGEHQEEASSLLHGILSFLCCLQLYNRQGMIIEDLAPVILRPALLELFVHNTSCMILKEVITAPAA